MPKTAHAQDRTCPRYGDLIIDRHVASNAGHAGHDGRYWTQQLGLPRHAKTPTRIWRSTDLKGPLPAAR